jgi:hypothetical protein
VNQAALYNKTLAVVVSNSWQQMCYSFVWKAAFPEIFNGVGCNQVRYDKDTPAIIKNKYYIHLEGCGAVADVIRC